MKAFILAAGVSRRLYPETYNTPKCLLDVGGKPIINYQLEAIQNIGIQEVTMIVGYHREMLIKHVTETFPGLSFEFIINNHYFETNTAYSVYLGCRKLVLDELNDLSKYQFKILQGQTGSAKTKILNCLYNMNAQVIDLENLACHRGSLLGSEINKKQHSQRYFESLLHNAINKFDCTKPIFIESESSKIGKLHLPKKLWLKLNESDRILLNVPIDERINFLLKEYKHLTKDCKLIQPFISGMKGKVSNEKLSNWTNLIQKQDWKNFVKEILENHYDPKYNFSATKHMNKIKHEIDIIKLDKLSIDNASKKILEYFN